MPTIKLTRGLKTRVDAGDFEFLSLWKWHAGVDGKYAAREGGKTLMHRVILNVSGKTRVDHINGNGLDNRRCNLRIATPSENAANRGPNKGRAFKGVFKNHDGFMARIKVNQTPIYLGTFSTIEEAARAYDIAAVEHFGRFASLNLS